MPSDTENGADEGLAQQRNLSSGLNLLGKSLEVVWCILRVHAPIIGRMNTFSFHLHETRRLFIHEAQSHFRSVLIYQYTHCAVDFSKGSTRCHARCLSSVAHEATEGIIRNTIPYLTRVDVSYGITVQLLSIPCSLLVLAWVIVAFLTMVYR